MPIDNNFYIFKDGTWQNRHRLNEVGQNVFDLLKFLKEKNYYLLKEVTAIYVTSQKRTKENPAYIPGSAHNIDKAIDIVCFPNWTNTFVFATIHRFRNFNTYIGLFKKFIHIDNYYYRNNLFMQNRKAMEEKIIYSPKKQVIIKSINRNNVELLIDKYFKNYYSIFRTLNKNEARKVLLEQIHEENKLSEFNYENITDTFKRYATIALILGGSFLLYKTIKKDKIVIKNNLNENEEV